MDRSQLSPFLGHKQPFVVALASFISAVQFVPSAALSQQLIDFANTTEFTEPALEADINNPLPTRRLRDNFFNATGGQGSMRLTLESAAAGANPAAFSTNSDRTMQANLRVTEDSTLRLFNYLKGRIERNAAGQAEVNASILVRNVTDGVDVLRINSVDDAGHWRFTQAANGATDIDDSFLTSAPLLAGKDYRITARLESNTGPIPMNTTAADTLRLNDSTRDYFFNVVFGVSSRVAPPNWRGNRGIDAVAARNMPVLTGGGKLTGNGINIGQLELSRPITDHADIDVTVTASARFPGAGAISQRGEHATAVGGIIVSKNANADLAGVAPGSKLFSVPSNVGTGATLSAVVQDALNTLIDDNKTTVINVSAVYPQTDVNNARLSQFINATVADKKVVLVAAMGNSATVTTQSPALAANAIAVGSLNRNFVQVSTFSNPFFGNGLPPHLSAPGESIGTTIVAPRNNAQTRKDANPPNDYDDVFQGFWQSSRGSSTTFSISGTSFAAPQVAGATALLQQLAKDAKFNAVKINGSDPDSPMVLRSILMSSTSKQVYDPANPNRLIRIRNRDGMPLQSAKVEDARLYKDIGTGLLWTSQAVKAMNEKAPLRLRGGGGGGGGAPPLALNAMGEILPSDLPTSSPLVRYEATGNFYWDTFNMLPQQQFEIALPTELLQGGGLNLAANWLWQGADDDLSNPNLNVALALYKDVDGRSDLDGIGSDQLLDTSLFDPDGIVDFPDFLGNDPLIVTADGGWSSAENLFHDITSASDEGLYYLRLVNLSGHQDRLSFAGNFKVPEPASLAFLACACGFASLGRRRWPVRSFPSYN